MENINATATEATDLTEYSPIERAAAAGSALGRKKFAELTGLPQGFWDQSLDIEAIETRVIELGIEEIAARSGESVETLEWWIENYEGGAETPDGLARFLESAYVTAAIS